MNVRCTIGVLAGILLLGAAELRGQAQVGPVWVGGGANNNWSTAGNWLAGSAPAAGSDVFYSYAIGDLSTNLDVSPTVDSLNIISTSTYLYYNYGYHYEPYQFNSSGPVTLTIGAGGMNTSNVLANFSSSVSISLATSQTWYIYDNYDPIQINGTITDNGNNWIIDGYGNLILNGSNNLTGSIELYDGALTLGNNNALGTAALVADYGILQGNGPVSINNSIIVTDELDVNTVNGPITLSGSISSPGPTSYPYFYVYGKNPLNLSGTITLNAPFEFDVDLPSTLNLSGHIVSAGTPQSIEFYDEGTTLLNGIVDPNTVSYYYVYTGKLIFGSTSALPTGATKIWTYGSPANGYDGYAGLGAAGVTAATYLAAFDQINSTGTIGFDNGVTITDPVDLTGFNAAVRLGSATTATLGAAATITPQAASYNFGGGGGTLVVASNLTGANTLTVVSQVNQPLSLELSGSNSFTGGITVDNSVLRFDSAAALPGTGTINLVTGGYPNYYIGQAYVGFGYNLDLSTPTASGGVAARFVIPAAATLVVGFDTPGAGSISSTIDLSPFPVGTYLGTSTSLTVSGPQIGPGGEDFYFAAVKDGHLTVASNLSGSVGLRIGLPTTDAFPDPDYYSQNELYNYEYLNQIDNGVVDFSDARSTVTLAGNNSALTGTVTLQGGRLEVGNSQALGTGLLNVTGDAVLAASAAGVTVPNDISISSNALGLDTTAHDITLSGALNGDGIVKLGPGVASLTGDVDFGYYIRVEQGTLDVSSPSFYSDSLYVNAAGTINFHTADPAIAYFYGDAGGVVNLDAGTTMAVQYGGYYAGTIAGAGAVSNLYDGVLELTAANSYTGGTSVYGGAIIARVNGALGPGAVLVSGGELDLGRGVTLTNTLNFTSGTIGGFGTFSPASGPITIGANQAVSPGLGNLNYYGTSAAGALNFGANLTLAPGGTYLWNLIDASNVAGSGWSEVNVNGTLAITATSGTPFIISLFPGGSYYDYTYVNNFPLTHPYSWTIATASGGITGFNAADFTLDTTYFASLFTDYPLANFDLTQNGNSLVLNFDPVPEPSTYALLAAGLGVIALGCRRPRNRAGRA